MDYYRQKQFACAYSKKADLTYEEALASEAQFESILHELPEVYIKECAKLINTSEYRVWQR